jgi:hypothetical protein
MSFWDLPSQKVKSSRVNRRCCGCGVRLPIGSSLMKLRCVMDGEFMQHILCMDCSDYLEKNADDLYDPSEGLIDLSMIGSERKKESGHESVSPL